MSGGSLDYAYNKVEDAAYSLARQARTPLHRAFAAHLVLVAKALHDIEWMLSGDTAPGDETEAINACTRPGAVLELLIEEARTAAKALQEELSNAGAGRSSTSTDQ